MHNQDKTVENNLSRKKMEKSIRNENKKKQLVNYYRCEMGFKATCQQGREESRPIKQVMWKAQRNFYLIVLLLVNWILV